LYETDLIPPSAAAPLKNKSYAGDANFE